MDEFMEKKNGNPLDDENNQPDKSVNNPETETVIEEIKKDDIAEMTEEKVDSAESNTTYEAETNGAFAEDSGSSDNQHAANQPEYDRNFSTAYNPVNFTEVKPVSDYKPMSKGLKMFSLIMAAVIMLTGASLTGYFVGKNSSKFTTNGNVSVDLSAKPADTDEMTAAQVYDKVNKSVVGIAVYNEAGQGSQASGVVYSKDGYIVTNDHIYSEVASPKFKIYMSDGKEYEAKYVAGDKISDLAILKIESGSFEVADFGDSNQIVCGESVVAIGRPNDATRSSSITQGIISVTSRRVQTTSSYSARLIQTDSAINPGSSGGALVNMYGQVIGITSSKLASVEYDAVGYAIPTTTMKRIVEELISNGKVKSRAKLGISYTAINSITAEINKYDNVGLYVAEVSEDSDLYGKISKGDIITYINDIQITSDDVVLDLIEQSSAGDVISVTIVTSSGETKNISAKLKANIGESSYTTKSKDNSSNSSENSSGNSSGGTFDFPFGE